MKSLVQAWLTDRIPAWAERAPGISSTSAPASASTPTTQATMTRDPASAASALTNKAMASSLGTLPQTPTSACTRTPGSATSCARTPILAPTTESTPAPQHGPGTTSHTTVDSLGMTWTRTALVGAALFAPLSSSDIGRIKTFLVNLTGSLGTNRETLSRT